MGDDPYDFDIAIPSGGGGGASALDKAKCFLSKYSTKATAASKAAPSASGRTRRVEMSLDDEDFSLDSSGGTPQKPSKAATGGRPQRRHSSSSEDAELSQSVLNDGDASASAVDVADKPLATRGPSVADELRPVAKATVATALPAATAKTTVAATTGAVGATWGARNAKPASVSDEDDDEDEVESIVSQSDVDDSVDARRLTAPPASMASRGAAVASPLEASENGVYEDDAFDEASESVQHMAATNAAVTGAASRDEDSHAQYSLDFVDDADLLATKEAHPLPPVTSSTRQIEMDDDDDDARSNASSASDRNKDSYVEASSGEEEDAGEPADAIQKDEDLVRRDVPAAVAFQATELSEDYSQDDRFESESAAHVPAPSQQRHVDGQRTQNLLPPSTAVGATPPAAPSYSSPPVQTASAAPPPPPRPPIREEARPRVRIVREYEQPRAGVETRDAATQFTGNHASIQADLTPDGMLTGSERRRSRESAATDPSQAYQGDPRPREGTSKSGGKDSTAGPSHAQRDETRPPETTPPPPPPVYATYGLYDPLQLSAETSMSTYKQHLLALQQQIHQKKLETERLLRDRIASRYTSLRGTDRFISSHRPPRMPLWEALVRVDPTLDETKAREIARLASEGAA